MWLVLLSLPALAEDNCGSSSPTGDDLQTVLVNLADSLPDALQDEDCPPPLEVGDGPIEPIPDPSTWPDDAGAATADADRALGPQPTLADPDVTAPVQPEPELHSVLVGNDAVSDAELAPPVEQPWTGLHSLKDTLKMHLNNIQNLSLSHLDSLHGIIYQNLECIA